MATAQFPTQHDPELNIMNHVVHNIIPNPLSTTDSPYNVPGSVRALDAHGAKDYLVALEFVDPAHIAVVGMSHGGWGVLSAVSTEAV